MTKPFSPLLDLLHLHMREQGVDRKQLGHLLASKGNTGKTFRRLDELLKGERLLPPFIARVVEVLEIPAEQVQVAWEAQCTHDEKEARKQQRNSWEATMKRRGPHLWARLPKHWHPSLITVVGPEFFLMTPVPDSLREIECDYEHLRAVGDFISYHHQNKGSQQFTAYEYRRSVEEIHLFATDGQWIEQITTPPGESFVRQRIGGRLVQGGVGSLLGVNGGENKS